LDEVKGLVVSEVEKTGPAESAGLRVSDVITKINGQNVNNEYDFRKIILGDDLRIGDSVNLEVIREKKKFMLKLKLAKA
ncbi:PDZ domain-containing protein, partial [bacterium]|nr:PDZ domain-containing protein [bacterium]